MRAPVVLYVDDERPDLDLFVRLFEDDLDVATAASGPEAIALLERGGVGVIVSDQKMPGMTGIELLATASDRWPHVRRMLLTAQPVDRHVAPRRSMSRGTG